MIDIFNCYRDLLDTHWEDYEPNAERLLNYLDLLYDKVFLILCDLYYYDLFT